MSSTSAARATGSPRSGSVSTSAPATRSLAHRSGSRYEHCSRAFPRSASTRPRTRRSPGSSSARRDACLWSGTSDGDNSERKSGQLSATPDRLGAPNASDTHRLSGTNLEFNGPFRGQLATAEGRRRAKLTPRPPGSMSSDPGGSWAAHCQSDTTRACPRGRGGSALCGDRSGESAGELASTDQGCAGRGRGLPVGGIANGYLGPGVIADGRQEPVTDRRECGVDGDELVSDAGEDGFDRADEVAAKCFDVVRGEWPSLANGRGGRPVG